MPPRPDPSPPPIPALDFSRLKTYSLRTRHSKVKIKDFAVPWQKGGAFSTFLASLPDILAVKTFRALVKAIVQARRRGRPVILGMGAHPTKVGLNPVLVDLMRRRIVTAVAMNGAVVIHDFELAFMGHTSEEVEAEIDSGRFGMAEETGRMLNEAISEGVRQGWGIGEAVGRYILAHGSQFPHRRTSILAAGVQLGIPVTVHVAIGTDIIHMHPSADGAALGAGSLIDFRKLAAVVSHMEGGVYLNVGSAVLLPEVFLKTVTLSRNLGRALKRITTANLDFLPHYRPLTNVVKRPTQKGGTGLSLIGHHEILLPLLAAAVIEELGP
ncbi:MAG: hypothetical protein D6704_10570 [Nitrospirae bacterium]|nr:MAG: hypothetical protein D6704_10570 [Nitrospirota bacterium]